MLLIWGMEVLKVFKVYISKSQDIPTKLAIVYMKQRTFKLNKSIKSFMKQKTLSKYKKYKKQRRTGCSAVRQKKRPACGFFNIIKISVYIF